jgi:ABC-type polar amino acid transport system ATPase subunit
MPFPIDVDYKIDELFGSVEQRLTLHGGFTTFVGPNGSGKTQVLRSLKNKLVQYAAGKKVRYLSSGRLALLENFRSNFDGRRGNPNYDGAIFGRKDLRPHRHNEETAYGDFHTLSLKPDLQIKVSERLRCLFKRDVYFEWDAGNLKVMFNRLDIQGNLYSSAREASGLLHLVVTLAALYDDEVGVLLFDEPEEALHPQLQAFLLREIQGVAGDPSDPEKKIVIIATHSTEMIDVTTPKDLTRIIFFKDAATSPLQVSPDTGELEGRKLESLLARLGQSHKSAFFSSCPLLVEGLSDSIICNAIDRRLGLYLGAAGTQIIPIIGKGEIPIVSKLMRLIGKTPIVLADLDTLADTIDLVHSFANHRDADKVAQDQGHPSLIKFTNSVYGDFCNTVDNNWNDIANKATEHSYWVNRNTKKDEKIAKRRAAMAVLLDSAEEDIGVWHNSLDWKGLYRRLTALFDCLETAGCFILRKGRIEDYYQFVDPNTSSDKPIAAVQEADKLIQKDGGFIERHYSDIVRALRYASEAPEIDEISALSELLSAVAGPALYRLSKETNNSELDTIARKTLGEGAASIFTITNITGENSEPTIQIGLNSSILNVTGFPIKLSKRCNVNSVIESSIRQKYET